MAKKRKEDVGGGLQVPVGHAVPGVPEDTRSDAQRLAARPLSVARSREAGALRGFQRRTWAWATRSRCVPLTSRLVRLHWAVPTT